MAPQDRQTQSDLAAAPRRRLEAEPWAFDFFQAVRRLEHLNRDKPRVGCSRSVEQDFVRFGQKPSLAFAPATIASYEALGEYAGRMLVYFLGLFGPNGPMPLDLTEFVIDWANGRSERLERLNKKTGSRLRVAGGLATERERELERQRLARFFDVFHHRLISLFYRAWAHHQPSVSLDRATVDRDGAAEAGIDEDIFTILVGSLGGFGGATCRALDAVPHHSRLHQIGHLSNPRCYPEGLEAALEDYFGVEARVIEFVGQWIDIPDDRRPRLGVSNHRLGAAALPSLWEQEEMGVEPPGAIGDRYTMSEVTLGKRVYDRQQKFRLRLGPMPLELFERLIPGGALHRALIDWVRSYVGDALAWDVQFVLDRAPTLTLGDRSQLGLTTWLSGAAEASRRTDLDDFIFEPLAIRTAPDGHGRAA